MIEIFLDVFDPLWLELEEALSSLTEAAHNPHILQYPKMFSDCLSRQLRA